MTKTITSKTKMNEILSENEKAIKILFEAGMSCIGCPMAMSETLEDGCLAHGMSNSEIDKLIKKLNEGKGKSKKRCATTH